MKIIRLEVGDRTQLRNVKYIDGSLVASDKPGRVKLLKHTIYMDNRQSEAITHLLLSHWQSMGLTLFEADHVQPNCALALQVREPHQRVAASDIAIHSQAIDPSTSVSSQNACAIAG